MWWCWRRVADQEGGSTLSTQVLVGTLAGRQGLSSVAQHVTVSAHFYVGL
jgi:hypothetical protein